MAMQQSTLVRFGLMSWLCFSMSACQYSESPNTKTDHAQDFQLAVSSHPLETTRFLKQDTATPICPLNLTYYACEHYAAASLALKYPNLIQQVTTPKNNNPSLTIRLHNGQFKVYRPEPSTKEQPCEVCSYQVILEYPAIQSVLISKGYSDKRRYILLNLATAQEVELNNYPFFNSNYQYFAVFSSQYDHDFAENALNIYQIDENQMMIQVFDAAKAKKPIEITTEILPDAVIEPKLVEAPHQDTVALEPVWNMRWGAAKGAWIGPLEMIFSSTQYDDQKEIINRYYRLKNVVTATNQSWQISPIADQEYFKLMP